jgi:hypothetical protein
MPFPKPATIRQLAPACIPYGAVLAGLYGFHNAWATVLLYYAGILAVVLPRRRAMAAAFRGWNRGAALALALFGVAGGALLYILWPWLDRSGAVASRVAAMGLEGTAWPVFLVYFALLNPWLEESLWRGHFAVTAPGLHPVDLLFAGYHALVVGLFLPWAWALAAAAACALASWLWRRAAVRHRGILVPVLSHLAVDVTAAVALFARVS